MKDGKILAMFFNASPRKGWNTAKMLEAAKAGTPRCTLRDRPRQRPRPGKRLVEKAFRKE